ncbi:MAG: hypothetical protein P4L90_18105 [Rhodopila sp.]|nr:hypothetical protein [Rhodopila sp.]
MARHLLDGGTFQSSRNDYDWLGWGIYFWEANPRRGLDFAKEAMGRKGTKIKRPAVVGAAIDLGKCLDLTTMDGIGMVQIGYRSLVATLADAGKELPVNQDRLRRQLDCAVLQRLHEVYEEAGNQFDSVRGIFAEGAPAYPGAAFDAKTHVQIAVRNPDCIKGVFRVPDHHLQGWKPD